MKFSLFRRSDNKVAVLDPTHQTVVAGDAGPIEFDADDIAAVAPPVEQSAQYRELQAELTRQRQAAADAAAELERVRAEAEAGRVAALADRARSEAEAFMARPEVVAKLPGESGRAFASILVEANRADAGLGASEGFSLRAAVEALYATLPTHAVGGVVRQPVPAGSVVLPNDDPPDGALTEDQFRAKLAALPGGAATLSNPRHFEAALIAARRNGAVR